MATRMSTRTIAARLRLPAVVSSLVVFPLVLLQVVNRRFEEGFPCLLVAILWLLPTAFLYVLMPIVWNVRAGSPVLGSPVRLLLRIAFLILVAWVWGAILLDQLP